VILLGVGLSGAQISTSNSQISRVLGYLTVLIDPRLADFFNMIEMTQDYKPNQRLVLAFPSVLKPAALVVFSAGEKINGRMLVQFVQMTNSTPIRSSNLLQNNIWEGVSILHKVLYT